MLQPNRTVTEQDLSFWPLAALMWNSVNVTCDIFAHRGRHVDTTGIIWGRGKINGPWQIFLRSTERYHRAAYPWIWEQIPRTKSRVCMFRSRSCSAVLGLCGTYVRLMLVHVGLLDAILGPYPCHVELMLSQERRVPFKNSNFEGVTRWKLAAVGYRFPSVWVFVGELSSQSEKSIERDILLKRVEARSWPTGF